MDCLSGESSGGLGGYMDVFLPSTSFGTAYQSKSQWSLFLNFVLFTGAAK